MRVLTGIPVAGLLIVDVGATLSKMTVLSVLVEAVMPLPAASVTVVVAGMVAITVPLVVMPLTAALYVGPLPVTVTVFVPPAVPVMVTLVPVKPVTASLKTSVKLISDALVGSACPTA